MPSSSACATCGACCRSHLVPVSGHDVWLLSTRQRLSPEQFCVLCPEPEPRPEAFRLQPGGPHFSLALDKKGRFALTKPCIFLLELANGITRCGVYDDRPAACRAYPMAFRRYTGTNTYTGTEGTEEEGVVAPQPEALSPPGAWPAGEATRPHWAAALRRLHHDLGVYAHVVARWNARVAAQPGAAFAPTQYFSYLLNVYDRLAALGALGVLDDADPHPSSSRVRAIVDSFYPHIPSPS